MIGLNRERGWREGDTRTESLYMPEKKRLRDMTLEELRRGLCLRCDGNEDVCRSCRGQCAFGLRALKLVEAETRGLSDHPLEPLRGRPSGRNPEPLGTKLTKNQMAHAECMKRQRRNRVAKVRALIAAGTPESIAALAAGYGNTSAYRKAEAKCQAEARKEQDRHV